MVKKYSSQQQAQLLVALISILVVHLMYSLFADYPLLVLLTSWLFCMGALLISGMLIRSQSKEEAVFPAKSPSRTSELETMEATANNQPTLVIDQSDSDPGNELEK